MSVSLASRLLSEDLFRWFVGLSMDDAVWLPTVVTKNPERLTKHDAISAFFNEVVAMAEEKGWLSGEHFSVDGTLIGAWASHKSFVRKVDDDHGTVDGGNFKGQACSNPTHESTPDPDARLYRKGKTASELRFLGHTLNDNRHGLIACAVVTVADGHAERESAEAMIYDARHVIGEDRKITLGADERISDSRAIASATAESFGFYCVVTRHTVLPTSSAMSSAPC